MLNSALYERTEILVKTEGLQRLRNGRILVVGVGGVGGHCAEALVRAGVGHLTICDGDVVSSTNKNRQLIALDSTVGKSKVSELCARLHDINASCVIAAVDGFLLPEDIPEFFERYRFDVVVDCIDSVECKVSLLEHAVKAGVKVFSSGGAGGRLRPEDIKVGDLFETVNDGLSRACRQQLRRRGVEPGTITTVYSQELPAPPTAPQRQEQGGRDRVLNGTISYLPPMFGLTLASLAIRWLLSPSSPRKRKREK